MFDTTAIWFTCFWSHAELRRDLDAFMRSGRIQERMRIDDDDCGGRLFAEVALSYAEADAAGRLARRACRLVARSFFDGVPS